MNVAGVDGCHGGWLVVRAQATPSALCLEEPFVVETFQDVLSRTLDCAVVAADMPIGLSESGPREADGEARRLLGPRHVCVFTPPVRAVVAAMRPEWFVKRGGYRDACEVSKKASGKKISQQTFSILPKISEVDKNMTRKLQERVVETHPEVSFWALNGKSALLSRKGSSEGQEKRRALLSSVADRDVGKLISPASAARDDVYDACICAWTASRVISGLARHLPEDPLTDIRGLRMEIVY